MDLITKINSINLPKVKDLTNGDYKNVKEFWDKVIVPVLPDDNTIRAYHKLLVAYIKSKEPMLAMRAHYEENHGHINLRRGWLNTICDDEGRINFFFTDNFFAHYFAKMASDNYIPDYDDFLLMMTTRKFPFRYNFKLCKEEKEKLSFKQGKNPGIDGKTGHYLAHILEAGKDYCLNGKRFGTTYIENNYFGCGDRDDYIKTTDAYGTCYPRDMGYVSDPDYRKILVACFIRFAHPINNFICPNKKSCLYPFTNRTGIGESPELTNYAHNYFLKKFPVEYKEFLDLALAPKEYYYPLPQYDDPAFIRCGVKCVENTCFDIDIDKSIESVYKEIDKDFSKVKSKTKVKVTGKKLSTKVEKERIQIIYKIRGVFVTINKLLELFTNIVHELNKRKMLNQDDIDMLTSDRSKKIFGIRLPAVAEATSADPKRYAKKTEFVFNGKKYVITNDWYETDDTFYRIEEWACIKGLIF